jgi:hypothetical protein
MLATVILPEDSIMHYDELPPDLGQPGLLGQFIPEAA